MYGTDAGAELTVDGRSAQTLRIYTDVAGVPA